MKKILILSLSFFLFVISVIFGFWPIDQQIISTNFGQSIGNNFSLGINLVGSNKNVYPIADGEMIFYHEEGESFSSIPRGLGSFAVLSHEGGIQSVYSYLKKGSIETGLSSFQTKDKIGVVGSTGASQGGNLFLEILNMEENEFLNPIKHLRPYVKDKNAPIIKHIYIKVNEQLIELDGKKDIKPGHIEILATIYDLYNDKNRNWELAPYKIDLSINGRHISSLSFDSIKEIDNEYVVANIDKNYTEIYESNWIYKLGLVELVEGNSNIQVDASDFSGNVKTRNILIKVKQ